MAIGDPNWGNVVLACRFNGEGFIDKSPSKNVITPSGSAVITTAQSNFGGASLSLTSGSALISSPDFDFGTGDFSIAFWVYPLANYGSILSLKYAPGNTELHFSVEYDAGKISVGSNSTDQTSPTSSVPIGAWTYVTASRRSGSMYLSIGGTVYGPYSIGLSGAISTLAYGIKLGGIDRWGTGPFSGYIEDLVITKGVDPYTATFTAPTAPVPFYYTQIQGTIKDNNDSFARRLVRAHQCSNGAVVDETLSNPTTGAYTLGCHNDNKHYVVVSDADAWITYLPFDGSNNATVFPEWSGKTVTPSGNAKISTTQSKFGGASLYLDGTGDFLTIQASPDLNFGTGDVSIELWVRLDSISVERAVLDTRDAANDTGFYLSVTAANTLAFFTNNATIITGTTSLSANTWYHLSIVKAAGTVTLYLDGTSEGSGSANYLITTKTALVIGRKIGSTTNDFIGHMDDLQISKGVARRSGAFTKPSVSFADSRPDGAKNAVILDLITPI